MPLLHRYFFKISQKSVIMGVIWDGTTGKKMMRMHKSSCVSCGRVCLSIWKTADEKRSLALPFALEVVQRRKHIAGNFFYYSVPLHWSSVGVKVSTLFLFLPPPSRFSYLSGKLVPSEVLPKDTGFHLGFAILIQNKRLPVSCQKTYMFTSGLNDKMYT